MRHQYMKGPFDKKVNETVLQEVNKSMSGYHLKKEMMINYDWVRGSVVVQKDIMAIDYVDPLLMLPNPWWDHF